ncbi:hypothetical protein G6047_01440, partial [Flavobacterium sp. SE-s28]|nr:hypothetical protein [Flavobacterium silvaticum]
MEFPNCTGSTGLGDVGCLGSTPNGTWFTLKIDQSGNLQFDITQTSQPNGNGTTLDVDFIAFGPFSQDPNDPNFLASLCDGIDYDWCDSCPNNTTSPNYYPDGLVVDCSFDASYTETLHIDNAQNGQIYMVLITNYSDDPGYISFTQESGAGSTDCNYVCPLTFIDPGFICPGYDVTLVAESDAVNPTFQWYDPAGNAIPGATTNQLTVSVPGIYTLEANGTIATGSACNNTQTVEVFTSPPPTYTAPTTLFACNEPGPAVFDLTSNIPPELNPNTVAFYHSEQDALYLFDNITNPTTYQGADGEIIWMSIESVGSGCIFADSFPLGYFCEEVQAGTPGDLTLCADASIPSNVASFDLSGIDAQTLGANSAADYQPTIHLNSGDADTGAAPIDPAVLFSGTDGQVLWVRLEKIADPTVYSTAFFTLHVNPLPTGTISASATSVCIGGTTPQVTFTATTGTAPFTFTYTDATGQQSPSVSGNSLTIDVPASTAGPVTVTFDSIVDANGCSQLINQSVSIDVLPLPEATITSNVAGICQGSSPMTVTFTGSNGTGPYSFTYSVNNGSPLVMDSTYPTYPNYVVDTSIVGPVNITLLEVSDANCSNFQGDILNLEVYSLPSASATVSASQVCQDAPQPTVTFTADPTLGESPYTFNYTLNGGIVQGTTLAPGENIFQFVVSTASTGTYDAELISISDVNGCIRQINQTVSVTVVGAPVIPSFPVLHVCDDNND